MTGCFKSLPLNHPLLNAGIVRNELGDQFQFCHVNFIFSVGNEWFSFFGVGFVGVFFPFPFFFESYSWLDFLFPYARGVWEALLNVHIENLRQSFGAGKQIGSPVQGAAC